MIVRKARCVGKSQILKPLIKEPTRPKSVAPISPTPIVVGRWYINRSTYAEERPYKVLAIDRRGSVTLVRLGDYKGSRASIDEMFTVHNDVNSLSRSYVEWHPYRGGATGSATSKTRRRHE